MPKLAKSLVLVALAAAWASPTGTPGSRDGSRVAEAGSREPITHVPVDVAVSAAKEVLVEQGFKVLRVEIHEGRHVVYYHRRGGWGRRKHQGPPSQLVLREVDERLVLDECPERVRAEIEIKLGMRL